MKRKIFAICAAAILLLAGCGGDYSGGTAGDQAETSAPSTSWTGELWDMDHANSAPPEPEEIGGAEIPGSSVYQNPDAKLIRRAELNIQTEQFEQSLEALNRLTAECGGYFESASVYGGGRRDAYADRSGAYIVRVPSEQYSQFLSGAGNLGYVTSKKESSENVGERYYDIETRLKTQRTKQERLLSLLERAETMVDIIDLENALSEVEYQIEMYSSDLKQYDALIEFATVTISLNEVGRVTQEVGETASLGRRMAAGFQASLRGLAEGFQEFLVWVSYNLFLSLVLAAVIAAAAVVGCRELKKPRAQNTGKPEEKE